MKKIILLLTLCFTVVTISCDKEPSRALYEVGAFKFNLDGRTIDTQKVNATIIDNVMSIKAVSEDDTESIVLTINSIYRDVYQLGIVNSGRFNSAEYFQENNTGIGGWVSKTNGTDSQGVINISDINGVNKTITGTFSFTGTNPLLGNDEKQFTEGSFFEIPYTSENTNTPDPVNSFSAKIDGVAFGGDKLTGTLSKVGGIDSIAIIATESDVNNISLIFPSSILPGNYDFGLSGSPSGQYNILTPYASHIADGSFTIASHDIAAKRITGTFSFIAKEFGGGGTGTFDVTEGTFDVTYQ